VRLRRFSKQGENAASDEKTQPAPQDSGRQGGTWQVVPSGVEHVCVERAGGWVAVSRCGLLE